MQDISKNLGGIDFCLCAQNEKDSKKVCEQ